MIVARVERAGDGAGCHVLVHRRIVETGLPTASIVIGEITEGHVRAGSENVRSLGSTLGGHLDLPQRHEPLLGVGVSVEAIRRRETELVYHAGNGQTFLNFISIAPTQPGRNWPTE